MGKSEKNKSLAQRDEKKQVEDFDCSKSFIKKNMDKYDNQLIKIFIDTLNISLKKINIYLKQVAESKIKVDCMIELDKIFQSSNYMGILPIANWTKETKLAVSIAYEKKQKDSTKLKMVLNTF